MTPLNDKLIAVTVSPDAHDFAIQGNLLLFMAGPEDGFSFAPVLYQTELLSANYSILGLCKPDEIGFDCELYVEQEDDVFYYGITGYTHCFYKDYVSNTCCLNSSYDSFRSLLHSHNLEIDKCLFNN